MPPHFALGFIDEGKPGNYSSVSHSSEHSDLSKLIRLAKLYCLLLGLFVGFYRCPATAEAFRVTHQGAAATGQANAFAAQADDPSALYYNPAGISQLSGVNVLFGTNLINGSTRFESQSGTRTNGDLDGDIAIPPPSSFYFTADVGNLGLEAIEKFSLGLGVFNPYGLRTRYPDESPISTAAVFGSLPLIEIRPVIAIALSRKLSIALGLDIYTFSNLIAHGETRIQFRNPGIPTLSPGAMLEFRGDGTAIGFNAGLLFTPLQYSDGKAKLSFALTYQNRSNLKLAGIFLANNAEISSASATLNLPRVYTAGLAYWPIHNANREWKVEVDVDYSDWHNFDDLDIHLGNGFTLPFPQDWTSSIAVKWGTEYTRFKPDFLPDWDISVRGGYSFTDSPMPDRTFTPIVADANYHTLAFGAGLTCRGNGYFFGLIPCKGSFGGFKISAISLDLSYQGIFYETRFVSGNVNPNVDGRYSTFVNAGGISMRIGL